ncbi:MAG: ABC transporter permease [Rubrivivax sp. SCN 71-131]|jgi:NitT/TauT family transport system permease protein|nr:MAG: ABC transporter permease [Rubrivivax sp. SCN 71-131]
MSLLQRWTAAVATYAWSAWGAIASLLAALALWEWAAAQLGPLALPDPLAAGQALLELMQRGSLWPDLAATARRALIGLALSIGAGTLLGIVAGLSPTAALASRPLVTVMLGTPPIAWLVLALLWFGSGDGTPVFTVFIATVPIVFGAALQGTRTLDAQLRDMARAFGLPWPMTLAQVYGPHVLSYVFPAWITALGSAWKVVVMAELLASPDGVGAALAIARSQLDTAAALAWTGAVVASLLLLEYAVLEPIKREFERWRQDPT